MNQTGNNYGQLLPAGRNCFCEATDFPSPLLRFHDFPAGPAVFDAALSTRRLGGTAFRCGHTTTSAFLHLITPFRRLDIGGYRRVDIPAARPSVGQPT